MAIYYTYPKIMVRFLSTVVYVQTNLEENNGTNIYVGHSKSIVKSWLGIISTNTNLVGLLAEIICTDETTNHLSLVPFKQSIHYTDLTNLT